MKMKIIKLERQREVDRSKVAELERKLMRVYGSMEYGSEMKENESKVERNKGKDLLVLYDEDEGNAGSGRECEKEVNGNELGEKEIRDEASGIANKGMG